MNARRKRLLKGAVHVLVLPIARTVLRSRHLTSLARLALGRIPGFRQRLRAFLGSSKPLPPRRMHVPSDSNDLSPAMQAHYQELKRYFDARKS
jgi:hypothetical protein